MDSEDFERAVRRWLAEDPERLLNLLGDRVLRNPHPPSAAGNRFQPDPRAIISPQAHVELVDSEATIVIGPESQINHFAWLRAWGQGIRVGARCTLHHYSMLQGPITLGDDVRIGAHSVFVGTEHRFDRTDIPIRSQGTVWEGIVVGSDVYVGSNVTVLDGVRIGDGVVIGAGAVVTRDIPDYAVAAGVPARVIRLRRDP